MSRQSRAMPISSNPKARAARLLESKTRLDPVQFELAEDEVDARSKRFMHQPAPFEFAIDLVAEHARLERAAEDLREVHARNELWLRCCPCDRNKIATNRVPRRSASSSGADSNCCSP